MEKLLANHLSQSTGKLFTEPPFVYFKRKAKNAHKNIPQAHIQGWHYIDIQLYIGMNLDEKWGSNPYPFSGIASQKAESEERAQA